MVAGLFTAVGVFNNDFAVARQNSRMAVLIDDRVIVFELQHTGKRNFNRSLLGRLGSGTADVEGSHRQLRTRFTNGLRGNDADRFADVNRRTAGQIASIAGSADAVFGLAGQNRTDFDLFNAGLLDDFDVVFVNQLAFLNQNLAGFRMQDVFLNGTAQNTLADGNDDVAAVDDRTDNNAAFGTAVGFGNDHILSNVNQTTGQVTGVCGFQSRIRQTFTGTVSRVKVLKHGQTFFKVRDNRLFDNFAARFGHQTAHTGQLAHLGGGTAGAGVSHHIDGVDVAVFGLRNVLHHFVGNFIGAGSPDIDHLVVFLAFGNQTVLILLLKFLDLSFGFGNQGLLGIRNDKVILAERNTGLAGVGKAERHNLVDKQNRFFLAAMAVNDLGNFLLLDQTVDQRERNVLVLRQNLRNQNTSRSCLDQTVLQFAVIGHIFHTAFDFGMQVNNLGVQSHLNLIRIGKD